MSIPIQTYYEYRKIEEIYLLELNRKFNNLGHKILSKEEEMIIKIAKDNNLNLDYLFAHREIYYGNDCIKITINTIRDKDRSVKTNIVTKINYSVEINNDNSLIDYPTTILPVNGEEYIILGKKYVFKDNMFKEKI